MYNLLGFFPAPFVYGLANELSDNPKTSRYGMAVVMFACCLVTFFIFLTMFTDKDKNYFGMRKEKDAVVVDEKDGGSSTSSVRLES